MKHNRSKNAMLLMIIFICSICLNNVWARETGTMDQLEKENPDDVDKMNKVLYYYNTLFFENYTEEELNRQIEIADLIITHAGVGAIVAALKLKKRVIVVPRLGKYKEQNNDHQVQIMERYDKLGYIIPCTDLDNLDKIVKESYNFIPKEYKADKQGIINEIKEFIDQLS